MINKIIETLKSEAFRDWFQYAKESLAKGEPLRESRSIVLLFDLKNEGRVPRWIEKNVERISKQNSVEEQRKLLQAFAKEITALFDLEEMKNEKQSKSFFKSLNFNWDSIIKSLKK